MNICSNYGFSSPRVAFSGYKGHKDTEPTPWGTTWGEARVAAEEAEATKRMIQRETLRKSDDPSVREQADFVGRNPIWDEYLTQREFNKYHDKMMALRAAEEAKLRAAAGKKNYDEGSGYDIKDSKGRVVERGFGDKWRKRYEYDITYHVNRFGEYYDMRGAVKESKPDGTYVIMASPNSRTKLEEKFKNGSVEHLDNCTTDNILSVDLPDGERFGLGQRFLKAKQTANSRQYFSQYDDKNVLLEVFDDGTYTKA